MKPSTDQQHSSRRCNNKERVRSNATGASSIQITEANPKATEQMGAQSWIIYFSFQSKNILDEVIGVGTLIDSNFAG